MYSHFEKGFCEKMGISRSCLEPDDRKLLKKAYSELYSSPYSQNSGVPNQMPPEPISAPPQPPQKSHLLRNALFGGLAGAAGLYAAGKYGVPVANQFSNFVDNRVVNPVLAHIAPRWQFQRNAGDIYDKVENASAGAGINGLTSVNDIYGTKYAPDQVLKEPAAIAGGSMLGHLGLTASNWLARHIPFAGKAIGNTLDKAPGATSVLPIANSAFKRALPFVGTLAAAPDILQLADRASNRLGIQNQLGRKLMRGGLMGVQGGINLAGDALAGAESLTGIGALAAPATLMASSSILPELNHYLNRRNANSLLLNEAAGRAKALASTFTDALKSKSYGDPTKLQAWYSLQQNPEYLRQTLMQLKDNPALRQKILENSPFQYQG